MIYVYYLIMYVYFFVDFMRNPFVEAKSHTCLTFIISNVGVNNGSNKTEQ